MFKTIIILLNILFLTGCSVSELGSNREYVNMTEKITNPKNNEAILKNSIKEIKIEKTSIDLSYNKRLSTILNELGKLENRSYYLKLNNKSQNIVVPSIANSYKVRIKTFDDLNDYLEATLNKKLIITKNALIANKTKIVIIKDLNEIKNDLSNIDLKINLKNGNFKSIMNLISEKTGFNIIYGADIDIDLNKLNINYNGKKLSNFLNYLSDSFNLYVNVDYDNKIIKFNKYKKRFFDLIVSDNNTKGTTKNDSITAITSSSALTNSNSLTNTIDISIYKNLKDNLDQIFKSDIAQGQINDTLNKTTNNLNYYTLNNTTGKIMLSADKNTMKAAEKIINDFNESFSKQVKVTLKIYEVLVNNDYNYGIDIKSQGQSGNNHLSTNIINNVTSNILNYSNLGNGLTFNSFVASLSNIGNIVNSNSYFLQIRNHLPYNKKIITSTDYVKSVKTTNNTNTAGVVTQESTQETDTVNEGFSITIIPNIVGNNISLNVNPNITQLLEMKNEVYNDSKITLPKTNIENFTTEVMLKDGEKRIIGAVTSYERADKYKGVVPLKNFVLGGNQEDKYLRKETVFVISAKIVDN